MAREEDETLIDILSELPSENKSEEDNTKILQDSFMNPEEEKSNEKLKSKIINIESNKNDINKNIGLSFENFMTEYETKEKDKKYLILSLFFNSVIDMLNSIIIEYKKNHAKLQKLFYLNIETLLEKMPFYLIRLQRLFDIIKLSCPENEEKIYMVIDKERQDKKTIFENLINIEFKELYEYFIHDCKIIICGWHIYYLDGAFKTLKDVIKEKSSITKDKIDELKELEKLDNMEIETINLEDSIFG